MASSQPLIMPIATATIRIKTEERSGSTEFSRLLNLSARRPTPRAIKLWTPSAKGRATNPTFRRLRLSAMIHELMIGEESLYIAEDLHATAQQLRDLYWQRNDVEVESET